MNLYLYVANAVTGNSDPLGLWRVRDHQRLTLEEAKACGLSGDDAAWLAWGNVAQDVLHPGSWTSDTDPHHAMPGTIYQPIIDDALSHAGAESDWNTALYVAGGGLHTAQDQWADARRNPPGTIDEHKNKMRNPDIPADNPYEWQKARDTTRDYIRDFMGSRGLKPKCSSSSGPEGGEF